MIFQSKTESSDPVSGSAESSSTKQKGRSLGRGGNTGHKRTKTERAVVSNSAEASPKKFLDRPENYPENQLKLLNLSTRNPAKETSEGVQVFLKKISNYMEQQIPFKNKASPPRSTVDRNQVISVEIKPRNGSGSEENNESRSVCGLRLMSGEQGISKNPNSSIELIKARQKSLPLDFNRRSQSKQRNVSIKVKKNSENEDTGNNVTKSESSDVSLELKISNTTQPDSEPTNCVKKNVRARPEQKLTGINRRKPVHGEGKRIKPSEIPLYKNRPELLRKSKLISPQVHIENSKSSITVTSKDSKFSTVEESSMSSLCEIEGKIKEKRRKKGETEKKPTKKQSNPTAVIKEEEEDLKTSEKGKIRINLGLKNHNPTILPEIFPGISTETFTAKNMDKRNSSFTAIKKTTSTNFQRLESLHRRNIFAKKSLVPKKPIPSIKSRNKSGTSNGSFGSLTSRGSKRNLFLRTSGKGSKPSLKNKIKENKREFEKRSSMTRKKTISEEIIRAEEDLEIYKEIIATGSINIDFEKQSKDSAREEKYKESFNHERKLSKGTKDRSFLRKKGMGKKVQSKLKDIQREEAKLKKLPSHLGSSGLRGDIQKGKRKGDEKDSNSPRLTPLEAELEALDKLATPMSYDPETQVTSTPATPPPTPDIKPSKTFIITSTHSSTELIPEIPEKPKEKKSRSENGEKEKLDSKEKEKIEDGEKEKLDSKEKEKMEDVEKEKVDIGGKEEIDEEEKERKDSTNSQNKKLFVNGTALKFIGTHKNKHKTTDLNKDKVKNTEHEKDKNKVQGKPPVNNEDNKTFRKRDSKNRLPTFNKQPSNSDSNNNKEQISKNSIQKETVSKKEIVKEVTKESVQSKPVQKESQATQKETLQKPVQKEAPVKESVLPEANFKEEPPAAQKPTVQKKESKTLSSDSVKTKTKSQEAEICLEKINKSTSSLKKKSKYKLSPLSPKSMPKKKLRSDAGDRWLFPSTTHFTSSISFQNQPGKHSMKVRSGFTKSFNRDSKSTTENVDIFDDIPALNLRRRNSEPFSFRGFIWKKTDLPNPKDNKTSSTSVASSLKHLNTDELDDFIFWEAIPEKTTSCWEMSLYHFKRPWSVLSGSVFNDNRRSNTPGWILANLRNGGSLNRRNFLHERSDERTGRASFDVEPSIAQKNIDINNWLAALNFPSVPSIPSLPSAPSTTNTATPVESPPEVSTVDPAPPSTKTQVSPKRRKVPTGLKFSERKPEDKRKKFKETKKWDSDDLGGLMDLIRRKSGGFVTTEQFESSQKSKPNKTALTRHGSRMKAKDICQRSKDYEIKARAITPLNREEAEKLTAEGSRIEEEDVSGFALEEQSVLADDRPPEGPEALCQAPSVVDLEKAVVENIGSVNIWKYLFLFTLILITIYHGFLAV